MVRRHEPHNQGAVGVIQSVIRTVLWSDRAAPILVPEIPVGATIHGQLLTVDIITAFNGGGTDLLDVGTSGGLNADPNMFLAALDVSSVAGVPGDLSGGIAIAHRLIPASVGPVVTREQVAIDYNDQNADATAGEAEVEIFFSTVGDAV